MKKGIMLGPQLIIRPWKRCTECKMEHQKRGDLCVNCMRRNYYKKYHKNYYKK